MVIEKYMPAMTYFACTADTWDINHLWGMRMGRPQQIHTSLEWRLLVAAAAFAFDLVLAFVALQQRLVTVTPPNACHSPPPRPPELGRCRSVRIPPFLITVKHLDEAWISVKYNRGCLCPSCERNPSTQK